MSVSPPQSVIHQLPSAEVAAVGARQIVKHFAPSWFAAVMGTGVFAFGLLALFWSVTLVRSVRGALDGSLFQPH